MSPPCDAMANLRLRLDAGRFAPPAQKVVGSTANAGLAESNEPVGLRDAPAVSGAGSGPAELGWTVRRVPVTVLNRPGASGSDVRR
jgi:hypothetical protein